MEGFERFLRQFSTRPGRRSTRYQRQLGYLQALIPAVFRAAFADYKCDWHDRIGRALRSGDAVISFNYDTVIDDSLRRNADGIWSARQGYGFELRDGADLWDAKARPGPFPQEYLRLLKPHGSLHWTRIDGERKTLALRSNAYAQAAASSNIIPPTWDKTILRTWPWKPIWEESSHYLQDVRCLIVIGYSVPQTDLMTQALIKSSLSRASLRLLVVVDPDRGARGRVINLARRAIQSNTRVIEMEALEDFARLLDPTPDERRRETARASAPFRRALGSLRDDVIEIRDDLDSWDVEAHSDEISDLQQRVRELED